MDPKYYSLIELSVTGAAVIGLALWQLRSVNREIAKDKAKKEAGEGPEKPGRFG